MKRLWLWILLLLLMALFTAGCSQRETVSTAPTPQHPKPYPGMEEARSRGGTLVLPRGGAAENRGGK
jgi:ABC-type glycerol-3-phosphate transport system substrate-binding protein